MTLAPADMFFQKERSCMMIATRRLLCRIRMGV
jgi:hypothetical protein